MRGARDWIEHRDAIADPIDEQLLAGHNRRGKDGSML
jgi:hypothetical protein